MTEAEHVAEIERLRAAVNLAIAQNDRRGAGVAIDAMYRADKAFHGWLTFDAQGNQIE